MVSRINVHQGYSTVHPLSKFLLVLLVLLGDRCHGLRHAANHTTRVGTSTRPIIVVGILSLQSQSIMVNGTKINYIAASYVKWLESAGASAIPIPYDASDDLVEEIFTQINGLLFPGGAASMPPSAKKAWELATERNSSGDFFPVWGEWFH